MYRFLDSFDIPWQLQEFSDGAMEQMFVKLRKTSPQLAEIVGSANGCRTTRSVTHRACPRGLRPSGSRLAVLLIYGHLGPQ